MGRAGTADGEGVSPPLDWSGVPQGTDSVVVIVEDADAPTGEPLVHAIVVGLPGADGNLHEGALDSPGHEGFVRIPARGGDQGKVRHGGLLGAGW